MPDLDLIVDFLNTLDRRTFRRHGENHVAGERLTSPQALSDWLSGAAGLPLESGSNDDARPPTEPSPGGTPPGPGRMPGPADLSATIALRTALRSALDGDARPLSGYPVHLAPGPAGDLRLAAGTGRPWLDTLVETVAASAARGDWKRVKLCAAPDCRWAFHDTSRNGRGRWCEMGVCGNRHKTRAYRERRQQPTP